MKSTTRTATLAFGLAIAGSWSLGASDAKAQSTPPSIPTVPARPAYVVPAPTYVPATPRYVGAPMTNYRQPGPVYRVPGRPATTHNFNYESARRDLKLYKPWLDR